MVILALIVLTGCAGRPILVAEPDAPRTAWKDLKEQPDVVPPSRTSFGLSINPSDRGEVIVLVEGLVNEDGEPIPSGAALGIRVPNPLDTDGAVFIPFANVENWREGVPGRWSVEHNIPSIQNPLSLGRNWEPQLRYWNDESHELDYAKLKVTTSYDFNLNNRSPYYDTDDYQHILTLTGNRERWATPRWESATKIPLETAINRIAKLKNEVSSLENRIEMAAKRKQDEKMRAFERALNQPLSIGSLVCSRNNVVGAVERLGDQRIKISIVGKILYEPDLFAFDSDGGSFRIDQSSQGRLLWVDKDKFALCDHVSVN